MDFDFTPEQQTFRSEVRAWLAAHVPAGLKGRGFAASRAERAQVDTLRRWQHMLQQAGYVGIDWPREHGGRGASIMEQIILYEEMSRAQAPQPVNRGGLSMLGPTLMKHGTPAQRARHLSRILSAEELWCQGFSEPNAGSDLANLQTRAVLDGDHYVIDGQKVWTSMAHVADWGFFLVRTDPAAPKHKGITFILVDMKTPGITIRPLVQITGEAEFNEVFLDRVRVPAANVVGKVNEGWGVALTTLAYERDVLTMIRHISLRTALERLVALARRTKRNGHTAADDLVIRQKIGSLVVAERCLQLNGYRSLTRILRGQPPGPEGSTAKLFWSQVDQDLAEVATEVIGPYSQIAAPSEWAPDEGQWEFYCLLARGSGIRAGTTEILRNILGERVLGLPKD
jgi:alkylation response protein AidB-like acyl-CoA dehydrogenase